MKEEIEIDAIEEQEYAPTGNVVVPMSRRLALTELTDRTCKWPIGDPLKEDFHFCGNESPDTLALLHATTQRAGLPAGDERRRTAHGPAERIAIDMKKGPNRPVFHV